MGRPSRLVHRVAYEALVAPIPVGAVLDHVRARGCRHTNCINTDHLEVVTRAENTRRGKALITHCPAGHPYDEANTYLWGVHQYRQCRTCNNRRRRSRRRAAQLMEVPA